MASAALSTLSDFNQQTTQRIMKRYMVNYQGSVMQYSYLCSTRLVELLLVVATFMMIVKILLLILHHSMTKPKVTVVIPSYNHADYLPQRIESIINQTYSNWELLILDDCSLDNSREIIAAYSLDSNKITSFYNEHNSGSTFKQWQKGLTLAQGDYLWIAESDDFAEPTFLERLLPLLEADSSISMAYTNSTIVDEYNRPLGTTADWKNDLYKTTRWNNDFISDGSSELNQYLSKTCTVNNASAVLFRKKAMVNAGGVDTSFRYTGDWLMYQKLCLQGRIAYIGECLSNYREHSNNVSKQESNSKALFERQKCFAYIFDKGLSSVAKSDMLDIAGREFAAIVYNLLRRTKHPVLLLRYIKAICSINFLYYCKIQMVSIKSLK